MSQNQATLYEMHYQNGDASYRLIIDADSRKLLVAQRRHANAFVDVSANVHKLLQETLIDFADVLHSSAQPDPIVIRQMPPWSHASVSFFPQHAAA